MGRLAAPGVSLKAGISVSSSRLSAEGIGGPLEGFAVAVSLAGGQAVVAVRGDLDRLSAPELECLLDAVIDRGHRDVVLDLAELEFMDASGLRVVADGASRLGAVQGTISLRSPSVLVRHMLDITGLSKAVRFEDFHDRHGHLGPEQAEQGGLRAQGLGTEAAAGAETLARQLRRAIATPALDDMADGVLRLVVALAQVTISGADGVSVSLNRRGQLTTVAASNQTISEMDASQYATGEGPCVDASVKGRWFHVQSLAEERRWPSFIPTAQKLGINAILSNPLVAGERPVGALNIYSRTTGAFSVKDEQLAAVFASEASSILAEAGVGISDDQMATRLAEALLGRQVIAQAQGVIMEREHMSEDDAYTSLRRFSQRTGKPLGERAQEIVASTQRAGAVSVAPVAGES